VDEPPQEESGEVASQIALPPGEFDGPAMLHARSVLREQTRPVFPKGIDLDAVVSADSAANLALRPDVLERTAPLLDDVRVSRGKVQAEPEDATGKANDVPVAEVKP
jgi:hypothetical protein